MSVPMMLGERAIGMLAVESDQTDCYTEHHAELLMAVADQAAVAVENARLYEQARGLAALEERQKLARELHDSVSQALFGIGLGARTARTLLDRDPSKVAEPLDYVVSLAEAGLTEMRALIFELRPDALELEGLVGSLEKQLAALRARHGLRIEANLGSEPEAPLDVKETLYRIAQETLNNVVKHARASSITVELSMPADGHPAGDHGRRGGLRPAASSGHSRPALDARTAARIGAVLEMEARPTRQTSCWAAQLEVRRVVPPSPPGHPSSASSVGSPRVRGALPTDSRSMPSRAPGEARSCDERPVLRCRRHGQGRRRDGLGSEQVDGFGGERRVHDSDAIRQPSRSPARLPSCAVRIASIRNSSTCCLATRAAAPAARASARVIGSSWSESMTTATVGRSARRWAVAAMPPCRAWRRP
jgi:hypothetical protein